MLFPLLLAILCVVTRAAHAVDVRTENYFLTPYATPMEYEHFGNAIAVQNDRVLVSSPFGGSDNGGLVYEFANTDGQLSLRHSFTTKGLQRNDQFGVSLQLVDDIALVGAPYRYSQKGAAHVFKRSENGWNEVQELSSRALRTGARFGSATAMSAQRIVVGAPCQDFGEYAAYKAWRGLFVVYDLENGVWTERISYIPPQSVEVSQCGKTLAVSGDLVFVSCATDKYDTQSTKNSGVVYVYQLAFGGLPTVRELQRLTGVGSAGDYFGASLSVVTSASQTVLYVGAQGLYEAGADKSSGSLSIFSQGNVKDTLNTTASSFTLTTRLTPPSASVPVRYFGVSATVRGDRLVVGAFGSHNAKGEDLAGMGFYYKYDGQQWVLSAQMQKTNSAYLDRLGFAVGLSVSASLKETVILGADMCNFGANITGVAAVYNF